MGPRIVVPLLFASAEAYHGKAAAFLGRAAPRAGAAPTSLDEALGDKGTWAECWERLKGGKIEVNVNTLVNDLDNGIGPKKLSKMLGQLDTSDMRNLFRKLDPAGMREMVKKIKPADLANAYLPLLQAGKLAKADIEVMFGKMSPAELANLDLERMTEMLGPEKMGPIFDNLDPSALEHFVAQLPSADLGAVLGDLDPTKLSALVGGMDAQELCDMVGKLQVDGLGEMVGNLLPADLKNIVTTLAPDDLKKMVSKFKDTGGEALETMKQSLKDSPELVAKLEASLNQVAGSTSRTITDANTIIEKQAVRAVRRLARGLRRSLRAIE